MKRRSCLILGWVVLAPESVMSVEPESTELTRIAARMSNAPVQRGHFEQRKSIKGFRQALVSHGQFLMVRNKGVLWHTEAPFPSELVLTSQHLLMRDATGQSTALVSGQEPALRLLNQWLPPVLAGDLNALDKAFTVEGKGLLNGPWHLILVPRDTMLSQWLDRIEMEGDKQVTMVRWKEHSGDSTEIRFSRWSSAMQATAEELKRFD